MTAKETVAGILCPLVEHTVRRTVVVGTLEALLKTDGALPDVLPLEEQEVLDPRFDALRRPINPGDWVRGMPGRGTVEVNGKAWELDVSMGAIVEAARACGYEVYRAVLEALLDEFGIEPSTPLDEVAARFLVAAVGDEKVASLKSEGS